MKSRIKVIEMRMTVVNLKEKRRRWMDDLNERRWLHDTHETYDEEAMRVKKTTEHKTEAN